MKKLYERPDAEYVDLEIKDFIMGGIVGASDYVGEGDDDEI